MTANDLKEPIMHNFKSLCVLIFCGLLLQIAVCTRSTVAGNGSQTPNAAVTAMLYNQDGTPAVGVRVFIRPRNTLADTSLALRKLTADTASTVTDVNGRYAFDTTLDTGIYVIEAANGNDAVRIDSVPVRSNKDDTVGPDTLKPAGAIKGVIGLSEGGDPRKVFILAFGIDRFARVNADGSFKFSTLAEGKYDLRLISSLDNYGVLDTVNIPVMSSDTLDMGTIDLPFTGIPTPKNVSIAYDTLKQIVTLSWEKASPTLVNGYYVYRRNVDSNTVLARINTSLITDTLYKDSTGIQDQTYEYRVAAVDKNATEGTKSAGVSVKVVGLYVFAKTFGSEGTVGNFINQQGICLGQDSAILVADFQNSKIKRFTAQGIFINQFGISGINNGQFDHVWDVATDDSGYIYTTEYSHPRIQKFDAQGKFVKSWQIPTDRGGCQAHLTIHDTILYITYVYSSDIISYSTNGDTLWSVTLPTEINGFGYGGWDITTDKLGNIYVAVLNEVYVLDHNGNLTKSFPIVSGSTIDPAANCIAIDMTGNVFVACATGMLIRVYDQNGNYIAKWGAAGTAAGQFTSLSAMIIASSNSAFISDGDLGRIQKFTRIR